MEQLLEYSRLIFEEAYREETCSFECVKAQVENGFCRCICIPGIAMNYIAKVMECCYEEFDGTAEILWNSEYKTYFSESTYKNKCIVFNNYFGECYFRDDLCSETPSLFTYIKIRSAEVLTKRYGISYKKETLLCGKIPKLDNGMEYLYLFALIADTNRIKWELDQYATHLFRVFFFLFPYTGMRTISMNLKNYSNDAVFKKYNRELINDYIELSDGAQKRDTMGDLQVSDTIKKLDGFLDFNFWNIYDRYTISKDIKDLKSVLSKQLDIASKLHKRLKQLSQELEK